MARILVRFNGGNVPILQGVIPDSPDQPISDPEDTGFRTNKTFIIAAGTYCFTLASPVPFDPLWQTVNIIDNERQVLVFKRR